MRNFNRWPVIVVLLLLTAAVGFWAYQAGVTHGIEQSGKIVVSPAPSGPYPYPYPYPYYGWHRPWGPGFFFGPLLFLAFWLVVLRGLFWRRAWHGGYGYRRYPGGCGPRGPRGPRDYFDEWHREAHRREAGMPPAGGVSEP
jgi:hypothetical protein